MIFGRKTFASLLNIHGGDFRVVPTHLVFILVYHIFILFFVVVVISPPMF